ncbi:MAG: hypothetical protein ABWX67_16655 [Allosphingosinicella sp.]
MLIAAQMIAALLASAASGGWHLGADAQISFGEAAKPAYKLDCTGPELAVTQVGVTRLLDLQLNKPVSDTEGSTLPEGAALMALATDKVEPNMVRAAAVRNPGNGWDMTIRLSKDDPALLSLPKAKYVSLFTTGFTQAVELTRDDRKLLASFVSRCRGG